MKYNVNPDGTIDIIHSQNTVELERPEYGMPEINTNKDKQKKVKAKLFHFTSENIDIKSIKCPHCKNIIKQEKYEEHLKEKCPKLHKQVYKKVTDIDIKKVKEFIANDIDFQKEILQNEKPEDYPLQNVLKNHIKKFSEISSLDTKGVQSKRKKKSNYYKSSSDYYSKKGNVKEHLGYGDAHYANHGDYRYRENGRFGSTSLYEDYDN